MRARLVRFALDRGGLLALAVLAVYVALACPTVVDGDNAEYATLGTIGGVPHPTGYPLYMLWLRATSWLPSQSHAHAAALATAVIGVACVLVLHAACRAWGARPLAATIAVAIYAASPLVLRLNTQAEVFALANLVAATVLWLAAGDGPLRGTWRAAVLGLVAGLGLCDHVTCVLLAPIGILGIVRAAREGRAAIAVPVAIAGLAIGLVPYAYLVATAENPLSWGQHLDGIHALLHHFLREDYGGPGAFAPDPEPIAVSDNLLALARMLARTWLWIPLLLGLIGFVDRPRRRTDGEWRWGWAMLAASFVLAGPLLVARFDVTHEGPGLYVISRFFVLPALLLAIPIAVGLDPIVERLAPRRWLGQVFGVGVFVAIVATSLSHLQEVHSPAVERGVANMLRSLPQNAVAVVDEDDLHFGANYLQLLRDERPDVIVILSTAIGLPVYRERIEHRLGIQFPPGSRLVGVQAANAILASGRTLFVDSLATDILATLPSYPHGILLRVLPRGTPRPSIHDIFELNKSIFEKFLLGYPLPHVDADWPVHVHVRYVQTWQLVGDELERAGQLDDAAFAYDLGRSLAPLP